jgi:putative membrane protein
MGPLLPTTGGSQNEAVILGAVSSGATFRRRTAPLSFQRRQATSSYARNRRWPTFGASTRLYAESALGVIAHTEDRMKHLMTLIAAAVPLVASAAGGSPDEAFFQKVTEAGLAEVAAGKLAQTKGSRESVRQFGAMMVKDHGAANDKLKGIAHTKGITLPEDPDLKHTAQDELFAQRVGPDFDRAYIDAQIKDHKEAEALLQTEIALGKDADAKAFAQEILPKVQAHLKAIETIKTGT